MLRTGLYCLLSTYAPLSGGLNALMNDNNNSIVIGVPGSAENDAEGVKKAHTRGKPLTTSELGSFKRRL